MADNHAAHGPQPDNAEANQAQQDAAGAHAPQDVGGFWDDLDDLTTKHPWLLRLALVGAPVAADEGLDTIQRRIRQLARARRHHGGRPGVVPAANANGNRLDQPATPRADAPNTISIVGAGLLFLLLIVGWLVYSKWGWEGVIGELVTIILLLAALRTLLLGIIHRGVETVGREAHRVTAGLQRNVREQIVVSMHLHPGTTGDTLLDGTAPITIQQLIDEVRDEERFQDARVDNILSEILAEFPHFDPRDLGQRQQVIDGHNGNLEEDLIEQVAEQVPGQPSLWRRTLRFILDILNS